MKKIIIVGASSGIGLGLAKALASRGVSVGLAARRVTNLQALKEQYPENIEYESIDITHNNAPEMLAKLIEKIGGMDIYVHVAGIGADNPDLDPKTEAEIINTNAVGFARMVSSAYDYFSKNNIKGQIAAVTSVSGVKPMGAMSAYSASKKFDSAYLTALEQRSNDEKKDIIFTDIRPGWIRTPLVNENKVYPMEMTVEYVTPIILRAIVKHPRVAYVDWRWGLLMRAVSIIPNWLWVKLDMKSFT